MNQLEAAELVIEMLEKSGFDRADLPGPGDLSDAIDEAGYILAPADGTEA
jgi:hypothetical protein